MIVAIALVTPLCWAQYDRMAPYCREELQSPASCLRELLERWHTRDGAGFIEYGSQLSLTFLAHPLLFLHSMRQDKPAFDGWLEEIDTSTFKVFESQASVSGKLEGARVRELKLLVPEQARRYIDHAEHGEMSRAIVLRVESIEITFISIRGKWSNLRLKPTAGPVASVQNSREQQPAAAYPRR